MCVQMCWRGVRSISANRVWRISRTLIFGTGVTILGRRLCGDAVISVLYVLSSIIQEITITPVLTKESSTQEISL